MYLNKAIIIGNLTRDPELKALPSGVNVASFSLATNRTYKDKDGNKQESVDYHNIVVFGKQAENVGKYMSKGSSILIEGRMQTRSWEDKDGVKRYRTEIIAESTQFGPRRDNDNRSTSKNTTKKNEDIDTIDYPDEEINPDDIPF
jgi:single-strand DNA-binding protein